MANLVGGKTVNLELVGLDGNAWSLMGAFSQKARREGWSQEEISKVTYECMAGDYHHLLRTLTEHCVQKSHPEDVNDNYDPDEDE
jgi:hypothetical protein